MALSDGQVRERFGKFSWREVGRGIVAPEAGWVARNIVTVKTPFPLPVGKEQTGRIRCHRLVAEGILAALEELKEERLCGLIHSFDGCYVPRHVGWSAKRPLSRHAWGIALDMNAAEFPYGSIKRQDQRLVAIFARQGFLCGQKGGGLWKATVDPMHFEYCLRVSGS